MNQTIIDLLPKLLRQLSNGQPIHIPTISKQYAIPEKTIQDNIKKYLVPIEIAEIRFDKSIQKWIAKRGFLDETLSSEDELITMRVLEHHANSYGKQFLLSTQRLFNRFKRRASLTIYKKTKIEKIEKDDEGKLAIVKTAISQNKVLTCRYKGKDRTVYPLKIVLLEGFWYLFLWDTDNKEVRTYHLKSLEALSLQDATFTIPENRVIGHLDNAINAYFKDAELIPVKLLVHKQVSKYFKRQPLSASQHITKHDETYDQLDIWITDEMEIIPTIQQYLPYIKVISPLFIHEKILENIANYTKSDI